MSKSSKHDPQWARAKQLCRLNQEDIAKAKALGLTPKALMKNIPSPKQKSKAPVKEWIRELYAKKFGARTADRGQPRSGSRPHASAPPKSDPRGPSTLFASPPHDAESPWEDDVDDDFAIDAESLPFLPLEEIAYAYAENDPLWQNHRRDRGQMNLRWAAATLAVVLREFETVAAIALFGSVADSILDTQPYGPETEPSPRPPSRDLDLALWMNRCDDEVLRVIADAARRTLDSLASCDRIALRPDELDLHLLENATGRFLGRLRWSSAADAAPELKFDPGFILDPQAIAEPSALVLFDRSTSIPPSPPAPDDDCPF